MKRRLIIRMLMKNFDNHALLKCRYVRNIISVVSEFGVNMSLHLRRVDYKHGVGRVSGFMIIHISIRNPVACLVLVSCPLT